MAYTGTRVRPRPSSLDRVTVVGPWDGPGTVSFTTRRNQTHGSLGNPLHSSVQSDGSNLGLVPDPHLLRHGNQGPREWRRGYHFQVIDSEIPQGSGEERTIVKDERKKK